MHLLRPVAVSQCPFAHLQLAKLGQSCDSHTRSEKLGLEIRKVWVSYRLATYNTKLQYKLAETLGSVAFAYYLVWHTILVNS